MFMWRLPGHGCAPTISDRNASDAGIAVQDVVLAALLVVEHELHGDPRAARPFRVGRIAAVADEVAGIGEESGMGVIGLLRDVYGTAAAAMPPSDATGRLPSSVMQRNRST